MRNPLSAVGQAVIMSARNIRSNKMRSFLTTLGIIIGVMSVISMVTIVSSATDTLMGSLTDMGAGALSISVYGTPLKQGLTDKEIQEIASMKNVYGVSPMTGLRGTAVRNGKINENVDILGVNDFYFKKSDIVTRGRDFYSIDMSGETYICIVDENFIKKLFYGEDPLDQTVIINGITYTVVGIQGEEDDSVASSMSESGEGGRIFIPYRNAMKISGISRVKNLDVYVKDTSKTSETQKEIENYLYKAFNNNDDSYWIMNVESILKAMNTMTSVMTGLLTGIASIALLVGGIGIMNMMLVSVTERTKEIGLRKALGATPARIQTQFLLEAVFLSLMGGIIGLVLGLGVSMIAANLLEIEFKLSISAIQLGVGFSAAVGIIFGWAPAKKASNLNPIDALRSE